MNEKSLSVLEQYDIEVLSTYRFKGNYGCDTTNGRYILQQYENSNEKMETMHVLYEYLKQQGMKTDAVLERKEGGFVSISEDGYPYILKRWYEGQDCSINNKEQLCLAAKNLGKFHKACSNTRGMWQECRGFHQGTDIIKAFARHNKEMIHIRNYIKKRKNKNRFEMVLKQMLEPYYEQAVSALEGLNQSGYKACYESAIDLMALNHGSYNYHNLIFLDEEVVMVNMLKINYAPQLQDLYDFLRKAMEKNQWDVKLSDAILNAYDSTKTISDRELKMIKAMFSYPEKFWKIMNYYYNSNKSWYSEKNEEKLNQFRLQEDLRWNFIESL